MKVGVCILTKVSQHGHDYPPAETNYKMIMTLVIIIIIIITIYNAHSPP